MEIPFYIEKNPLWVSGDAGDADHVHLVIINHLTDHHHGHGSARRLVDSYGGMHARMAIAILNGVALVCAGGRR